MKYQPGLRRPTAITGQSQKEHPYAAALRLWLRFSLRLWRRRGFRLRVTVGVRFSPLASASAIRSSTVTVFRKYTFSPFFWRSDHQIKNDSSAVVTVKNSLPSLSVALSTTVP